MFRTRLTLLAAVTAMLAGGMRADAEERGTETRPKAADPEDRGAEMRAGDVVLPAGTEISR